MRSEEMSMEKKRYGSMRRMKLLHKIMRTTHMYEMLGGFLVYYFVTALIIWGVDPNITNFGDALWFCFATCTTVGFGDVVATSVVSRILTIILTCYGILVTAFIPAVVVNYFMEFNKIKSNESIVEFFDELENVDKLSHEELVVLAEKIKSGRNKL